MARPKLNIALKAWMRQKYAFRARFTFSALHNFDPQKVVAECSIEHLISTAVDLELYTECAQFTLDLAKVVVHLNPDPRLRTILEATQYYIDDPTDENKEAAVAAEKWARAAKAVAVEAWDAAGWDEEEETKTAVRVAKAVANALAAALGRRGLDVVGDTMDAYEAAHLAAYDEPKLVHELYALETRFRENVYKSLIVELEKISEK